MSGDLTCHETLLNTTFNSPFMLCAQEVTWNVMKRCWLVCDPLIHHMNRCRTVRNVSGHAKYGTRVSGDVKRYTPSNVPSWGVTWNVVNNANVCGGLKLPSDFTSFTLSWRRRIFALLQCPGCVRGDCDLWGRGRRGCVSLSSGRCGRRQGRPRKHRLSME